MNINVARLKKLRESIHKHTMEYIEIVTNYAGEQMEVEEIIFDPQHIDVNKIVELAAKRLEVDVKDIHKDYIDLMVLEGMIEIV